MKKTNTLKSVVFFLLISFYFQTSFSQDLAKSIALKPYSKMYEMSNNIAIKNAVLNDGKYTYKFKERDILVEIKNGFYYEYHPKKEFIKAKIDWISEFEYNLTIVDLEMRGAPFKIGSMLTAKITQIKGNRYFYKSTFNNKTGNGSFKRVK
ncbi:hypothetical protein [uncultured Polaribacter sp.]|uniref:hypothetical protein n=1 Tax=uncultured Polaribacter sp. TaxID=174711 RepID=UPI00259B4B75|nr:hypothetical protein [uncultured Polaribacter sp.]